jgi:hypothetical protein
VYIKIVGDLAQALQVSGVSVQVSALAVVLLTPRMKLHSFFFDLTGRPPKAGKLFRPAAGLTPDTRFSNSDEK